MLALDSRRVMGPVWLVLWAFLVALAWLIPNHYLPWSAFHSDAWMAFALSLGAIAPILRVKGRVSWPAMACCAAALACIPWLQLAAGLIPFGGQAWISSSYLSGFTFAFLIGVRWETAQTNQLVFGLFLAVAMASVLSVGLQLYTWAGLWDSNTLNIWSMGLNGPRPYANLGQPNQLATLLLWGLVGSFWFYMTGRIGAGTVFFIAAFLLVGLALTQSRMGILALTVLLVSVWFWRNLWKSKSTVWIALILYLGFWVYPFLLSWLNVVLFSDQEANYLRLQQQGELRLSAWGLFLRAIMERPWFGYGWFELRAAQLEVADRLPGLGVSFAQSHNLLLDLLLWTGIPIGLLISGQLIRWFWHSLKSVKNATDAVLLMFLFVVGTHSMVELPLHYAYFLLPAGLIMGTLDARLNIGPVLKAPRWTLTALWLATTIALVLTTRDYFRVEASYQALQFEKARIGLGKNPNSGPPDVLVLTHLSEWIRLARFKTKPGMTTHELEWMFDITTTYPTGPALYRLARAYVENEMPTEAKLILRKICKVTDEQACSLLKRAWA
jgi:O-antigen ligase